MMADAPKECLHHFPQHGLFHEIAVKYSQSPSIHTLDSEFTHAGRSAR